jgi:NTE family protein
MNKKLNLVLEGGGVKGIGLVGAVEQFEAAGYSWSCIGGTSAGAIVATLLAVGYTGDELCQIMTDPKLNLINIMDDVGIRNDFLQVNSKFQEARKKKGFFKTLFTLFSVALPIMRLIRRLTKNRGLFNGDYILDLIEDLIEKKTGDRHYTFSDLARQKDANVNKLNLMVTDISNGVLLILPHDLNRLGLKPSEMELAKATRMSMSFPLFFTPVLVNGHWLMDGGILSNFPYTFIDGRRLSKREPIAPTVGLLLDEGPSVPITGVYTMALGIANTMISSLDRVGHRLFRRRLIKINVNQVSTLAFDLDNKTKDELREEGARAAVKFLKRFDYEKACGTNLLQVRSLEGAESEDAEAEAT